ncbi:MAG: VCBS repeat-containing protein, partial [Anaerolineae bacterium]|nr:VCBS repeat-containing protein [Anaerolineae bacterium]
MKTSLTHHLIAWASAMALTLAPAAQAVGGSPASAAARTPSRAQTQQSLEPLGIESATLEWPMSRFNAQNTARQTGGAGNITAPAIRWQQYLGGVPPTVVADVNNDGRPDVISALGGRVIARTYNGEYLWISDPIPGLTSLQAANLDGQGG